jgi:hypothetical protein
MQFDCAGASLVLVSARFGIAHSVSRQHLADTTLLWESTLDAAFEPISHDRYRVVTGITWTMLIAIAVVILAPGDGVITPTRYGTGSIMVYT